MRENGNLLSDWMGGNLQGNLSQMELRMHYSLADVFFFLDFWVSIDRVDRTQALMVFIGS